MVGVVFDEGVGLGGVAAFETPPQEIRSSHAGTRTASETTERKEILLRTLHLGPERAKPEWLTREEIEMALARIAQTRTDRPERRTRSDQNGWHFDVRHLTHVAADNPVVAGQKYPNPEIAHQHGAIACEDDA